MGNKIKLIEKVLVENKSIKNKPLIEEVTILTEDKKQLRCIAAYTFPISRPNQENLNGRVYSNTLWENVIKKKMGEGAFGLMDHPKEDGSMKDTACVWKNVRFNENKSLVICDCYLFSTWGQHLKDAIDAGANVGLSSVGWGEFAEDDKSVLPESYELERPADFVLDPSYQVFGKAEDIIQHETQEQKINKKEISSLEEEDIQNKDENKVVNMSDKLRKLEERDFRHKINNAITDIEKIISIPNKLKEYKEIYTYWEDVDYATDLKEKVEKKIKEVQTEYDNILSKGEKFDRVLEKAVSKKIEVAENKTKIVEKANKKTEDIKTLKEKYKLSIKLLSETKDYIKKLKTLYQKNQLKLETMVEKNSYEENVSLLNSLKEDLTKKETEIKTLEKENKLYEKEFNKLVVRKNKRKAIKEASISSLEKEAKKQEIQEKIEIEKQIKIDKVRSIHIRNDNEVEEYYEDLLEGDPKVEYLKEDILDCKTLVEAQMIYIKYKDILEDLEVSKTRKHKYDTRHISKTKIELDEDIEYTDFDSDDYILKRTNWV